jgi:hypothetical protein
MAKGDSHMEKNVAKESCCIAPTLVVGCHTTQTHKIDLNQSYMSCRRSYDG